VVGEVVIRARVGAVEVVERGVEHFLVVVGQRLVDEGGELLLPVAVFDPAPGFGQAAREPDELFCGAAKAAAALEARSFHWEFLLCLLLSGIGQKLGRSTPTICRIVAECSSSDLVVASSQRMFSRRITFCAAPIS